MKKQYPYYQNHTSEKPHLTASSALAVEGARFEASLPSLSSNNSIESEKTSEIDRLQTVVALSELLTPYRKRQAHTLFSNVHRLIEKEAPSINHVGFLTLTFPENITDPKEAYDRFRSMNTNFLSKWEEIKDWICVKERQKRGAWHYHLIVVLKQDIRTGVDFNQLEERNYTSAGQYLRDLWSELRARLPEYGFGRSELLPVKSNAEAMGRYVGKYISKHIGQRKEEDKGVRLVNSSRGWIKNSVNFAWYTKNSQEWRRKLKKFADYMGCTEFYQLNEKLGPGWAYKYAEDIMQIDITLFENGGQVAQDHKDRTIQTIAENRIRNEKKLIENLTLHSGKSKKERIIAEARAKVDILITRIDRRIPDEKIERVRMEVEKVLENFPLREAARQKLWINRRLQSTEQFEDKKIEGVPF